MARILILCGGETLERRVSLDGGDAVGRGLARAGHEVLKLDTADPTVLVGPDQPLLDGPVGLTPPGEIATARLDRSGWLDLTRTLVTTEVDAVIPLLHGGWGEGGQIQGLLELLGIPFLGSGMAACALALDKHRTLAIAATLDIPLARERFFPLSRDRSALRHEVLTAVQHALTDPGWSYGPTHPHPLVLKPNTGGSTVGLTISNDLDTLAAGIDTILDLDDAILLEQFIPGREVTVPIVGDATMPMLEIVPHEGHYDYANKYTKGRTDYLCPAPVDEAVQRQAAEWALALYHELGCRHVARVDFRLTESGDLYLLELNTMPGMTDLSLVPMGAKQAGMDFPALMDRFVQLALGDAR